MKKLVIALVAGFAVVGCAKKQPLPDIVEIPAQSFSRAWSNDLQTKGDALEKVYVRDDYIFAYTHSRLVLVLDRNSGSMKFAQQVARPGSQLLAPVILADRIVYPATTTLEVFDKANGKKIRSIAIGSPLRSGAVGMGHVMYVGVDTSDGGRLLALDLDRPYDPNSDVQASPVKWELMVGSGVSSTPVLSQGVLYVGTEDGKVYAVSGDREGMWPDLPGGVFKANGGIVGDLAADDKNVFVPSTDSKLYVLDKKTGRIDWEYFAGDELTTKPVVTNDLVYLNVPNKGVVCIDKNAGDFDRKAKWTVPSATNYLAEDEKYAYVRLRGNILAAIDKQSGEIMFRSKRSDIDLFGVNVKDNIIYAATKDGVVIAIQPVLKPGTVGELVMMERKMPLGG